MKVVTTKRDIRLEFQTDSNTIIQMQLPPENKYVMSDGVTQKTLQLYGGNALQIVEDLKNLPNRYNNQDLTNKKLISIREGGAGDLLFKTPVFRYLKQKYPTCKIGLACSPIYHSLFKNNPDLNDIYSHIIPFNDFESYDYFSTFEGLIESNKEAEVVNAYDLFIKQFGIDPNEIIDKTPVLHIQDIIKEYWQSVLGEDLNHPKKIAFQWRASSPARTLPYVLSASLIKNLINNGYKVFLLDSMARKNDVVKFLNSFGLSEVVDTSKYSDNFERMAGIISLVDMFMGPDSSGTHIAAALGRPIIGMYGPFRSELRLKYYKNAIGIDTLPDKCKNGCFIHSYEICEFAKELGDSFSPCWKLLDISATIEAVNKLYKKVYDNVESI